MIRSSTALTDWNVCGNHLLFFIWTGFYSTIWHVVNRRLTCGEKLLIIQPFIFFILMDFYSTIWHVANEDWLVMKKSWLFNWLGGSWWDSFEIMNSNKSSWILFHNSHLFPNFFSATEVTNVISNKLMSLPIISLIICLTTSLLLRRPCTIISCDAETRVQRNKNNKLISTTVIFPLTTNDTYTSLPVCILWWAFRCELLV